MDEGSQLTPDACKRIFETEESDLAEWTPRVQCISIKQLTPASTTGDGKAVLERYRVIISDGDHFLQAMLNTKLNHLVEVKLKKYCTFKLQLVANNVVQNKRLVIVIGVDEDSFVSLPEKIGTPVAIEGKINKDPAMAAIAQTDSGSNSPAPGSSAAPAIAVPYSTSSTSNNANAARSNGGERPPNVIPIEGLSPYSNKWTIQARVTQKSEIKHWSNTRGEGKLFSCTFLDNSGEIKATAFNAACDELYERLQETKVYFISRARVNVAKKKFSTVDNQYEIQLERTTEVHECMDTDNAPQIKYNFVGLDQVETIAKDATCDVVAVVHELGPLGEIISKASNKPVTKRELVLVDRSEMTIRLTLWGKVAESFSNEDHPVIAVKAAKVGDFNGRSLSMFSSSTHALDPDIPEAHELRGWYDASAGGSSFRSQAGASAGLSGGSGAFRRDDVKTLAVAQETLLGIGDKPDYFNARVRIVHVRNENMSYTSCPGENCQKKVIEQDDGSWRCEKCGRSYPNCEYRYLLSLSCADHTGQMWLQGFNDVGNLILGITAKELHDLEEHDRDAAVAKVTSATGKQWNLSCRVKQETYQEQTRPRYGINRAYPVNYAEEASALLAQLKDLPPSVSV